jgi:hypothetical protein
MDVTPQFAALNGPLPTDISAILHSIPLNDGLAFRDFLAVPETDTSLVSLTPQSMVLAQQFDQDILGDMGNLWNTFIESGQVWALVIGIVVGYMIRNLTAY